MLPSRKVKGQIQFSNPLLVKQIKSDGVLKIHKTVRHGTKGSQHGGKYLIVSASERILFISYDMQPYNSAVSMFLHKR